MGLPFLCPWMGGILKLHNYMDLVDRAKQDARADEAIF